MERTIKLLKNNDNREWTDIEWMDELFAFLKGDQPEGMFIKDENMPKLSVEQAYSIIWYLQEYLPLLPDNIEKCDVCGELYDSYNSGYYMEDGNAEGQHFFCNGCEHLAPYDNEHT